MENTPDNNLQMILEKVIALLESRLIGLESKYDESRKTIVDRFTGLESKYEKALERLRRDMRTRDETRDDEIKRIWR